MPQKSKKNQQVERLLGPWKQEFMDEAKTIILKDVRALQADLADLKHAQEELKSLEADLKTHVEKTDSVVRSARGALESFYFRLTWHHALSGFIGGAIGGVLMFLLMWYVW